MQNLREILRRLDGRGYPAYKELGRQKYIFSDFKLQFIHVQGDPFAAPSKLKVILPCDKLSIDPKDIQSLSRRTGLEDGILRSFSRALKNARGSRGSGKSGRWGILSCGQEMFKRSAVEINEEKLIVRFTLGLPAAGRRILGREATSLLIEELPSLVENALLRTESEQWHQHALTAEDQDTLRAELKERGWIAFIANGSILPRLSGVDDRPLKAPTVVPWQSPVELEEEVRLPNAGVLRGTAIAEGITLICGGGYHGKSTLLQAIARGVYNHIPGDGREWCISRYEVQAIRAEDGRSIQKTDISNFISNLPSKMSTQTFVTPNASGSTSQAANISEALELGAEVLLIDEDTSATNFMIRDRRMQELVKSKQEPITPFIDRIREMYERHAVSVVLVIGGSGDYFDIADLVLTMESYLPKLQTEIAKQIAETYPSQRLSEEKAPLSLPTPRHPNSSSFLPSAKGKRTRIRTQQTRAIQFGTEEIEVSSLAQLVDAAQTKTLADWLLRCSQGAAEGKTLSEICQHFERELEMGPLSATLPSEEVDRAYVRRFEFGAAINRLRSLNIRD